MKKRALDRTRGDLCRTMLLLLLFNVLPICWRSINPILKGIGLAIPSLLLLVAVVVNLLQQKRFSVPYFALLLGVFIPLQWVLSANALIPAAAKRFIPETISVFVLFLLVCYLIKSGWRRVVWEDTLIGMGILYSLLGFYNLLHWLLNWWSISPFPAMPPTGYRLGGVLIGHPNHVAAILNLILPFVLIRFLHARNRTPRITWAGILFLFLAALFQTSSRGGWLGSAAAILISCLVYYSHRIRERLQSEVLKQKIHFNRKYAVRLAAAAVVLGGLMLALFLQIQHTPHRPILLSRGYIWRPAWAAVKTSPVLGHGPGSFTSLYASFNAPPPNWITSHAHNLLLQLWIEYGISGVLVAASMFILLSVSAIRVLKNDRSSTTLMAPVLGAIASVLIHQLFEYSLSNLLYTSFFLILCCFILTQDRKLPQLHIKARLTFAAALILLFVQIFAGKEILHPERIYYRGINPALQKSWLQSENSFCAAAELKPDHPFYSIQCALSSANAQNTLSNPDYTYSIEKLSSASALDPGWPVHSAALSSIYWQAHETNAALTLMWKASVDAPRISAFHLNLGLMLEAEGSTESAIQAYTDALQARPSLAFTSVMQQSDLRTAAVQSFISQSLSSPELIFDLDTSPYHYYLFMGDYSLSIEDLESAETYFDLALDENERSSLPYTGLSEVMLKKGDLEESETLIRKAIFLGPYSAPAHFLYGRILRLNDEPEAAAAEFGRAFSLTATTTYSQDYTLLSYDIFAPQADLPAFFIHGYLTEDILSDLAWLADFEEARDRSDRAETIQSYISTQMDLVR